MTSKQEAYSEGASFIFIGGAPRSGTTLLQRIFAAHPEISGSQEFAYTQELMDTRRRMLSSIKTGHINKIVDQETLDATFYDFFSKIFLSKMQKDGKRLFSEKTPFNAMVFGDLRELFPKSKHILILRDPRDIVSSMLKVGEKYRKNSELPPDFVRSTRAAIMFINRLWDSALNHAEKDKNTLVVYYEDLVQDPKLISQKICDFLGVNFTSEMIEIQNKTFDAAEISSQGSNWYTKDQLTDSIQSKQKNKLNTFQKNAVERFILSRPELSRYNLNTKAPTVMDRIFLKASRIRASTKLERRLLKLRKSF